MTDDEEPSPGEEPDSLPGDAVDGNGRPTVVFHYNRERRLARAPENVQRAYREGYTPNKGFIKGLTANAGLKSILAVIVILCALIIFLTVTGTPGLITVGGVPVRAKAFSFEDKVYFTLTCEKSPKFSGKSISVSGSVQILDADGSVLDERPLTGLYTGSEQLLRAVLRDEGSASVRVLITAGDAKRELTVTVDRK
ncbi:MAG TPA: hypothetical protein PK542_05170 [Treponemataceae bacterium]|nr:hypothetical protein [Treponemataceae bacterium]HPS43861.1 hypothetical protein [Treponemataceae bacterium]